MTEKSFQSEWERVWGNDALDESAAGISILIASSVMFAVVAAAWHFRTWPFGQDDRFVPSAADIIVRPPPPR